MAAQLPGIFQSLAPVLDRYGYAAELGLVGAEGFGIPAPGQTVLIAAGVYTGTGQLNLAVVLTLGLLAAVGGDNVGRYGGRPLVSGFGRHVLLPERRLAWAERFCATRGNIVVPVRRLRKRRSATIGSSTCQRSNASN